MKNGLFVLQTVIVLTILPAFALLTAASTDFSGTWIPITDKPGGAKSEIIIVTQDKTGMTAVFTAEGKTTGETIRYEFGKTQVQKSPAQGPQVTVTSSWQGDRLVAISTIKMGERTRSFEQAWSMEGKDSLSLSVTQVPGQPAKTTVYKRIPAE